MSQFGIITASTKIQRILDTIEAISNTSTTVLITGETGTGKELIAKAIHQNSSRSKKRFLAINCGIIPSELMESELFGHEKGSFTGANRQTIGKLEYANGETVFLDEISSIPLPLQIKLLRVIQERTIERIGSLISSFIDVRFIAATNVSLEDEIRKDNFREDLYYRLNVLPIIVPPLRDRKEDIPLLIQYYLDIYAKKCNKQVIGLTDKAMEYLTNYPWFGNVRELQNLIEMFVVLSRVDSKIDVDLLPPTFLKNNDSRIESTFDEAVRTFERDYILNVLNETGWNRLHAAKKLGMHRNTLLNKMKGLGIQETH
ncbi:MAG: hypothetical protein A2235_00725 [Deltaproteobacteria bacterium RIFOXYA2_FULL_42_10]|nr:MAG: hypothetical protein A2235_00725 [Deltaproteobacteria bacterium RIFOXYA2_FULL_42_10]